MTFRFRRHLTAGLLVAVPVVLTGAVLAFLFRLFDGWIQPFARDLFGREVPGAGIVVTLVLLWLTGALSANFAGKKLLEFFDRVLENLPLVKTVYSASKQLVEAISPDGRRSFRRVVLVEFPQKGTYALGFVTGHGVGPLQGRLAVYVPTAINPTSGFVVFAPPDDLLEAGLTVEEAIKLVVSGGVVSPAPPPAAAAAPPSEAP